MQGLYTVYVATKVHVKRMAHNMHGTHEYSTQSECTCGDSQRIKRRLSPNIGTIRFLTGAKACVDLP
jgi:hypothetical protein